MKKAIKDGLEDIEEFLFRYLDGLMIHYYEKLPKGKKLSLPKSKLEFYVKDGALVFGKIGKEPYSERGRIVSRKEYANILLGMSELEPGLALIHGIYVKGMKDEKLKSKKLVDFSSVIKEASWIVQPYYDALEKRYNAGKTVI